VKIVTTWVAVGNRLDTALPFSLADLKLLDPQDNPFDVNVDPIWVPALKAGDIPGRTVIGGYVSWKVPWHVWPQAVIYKPQGREGGLGVGWGAAFFSDLNYGNRYYTFVGRLFFRGMTSGYGESTYRPDRPITVAQFSKLLVLAVAPYNKADLSYPSGYLQEASRAGLATWGTKGPLAKVTRLEAALAVARAGEDHLAQAPVSYVLPFTDVRGLAKSDIALLAFNGVVRGTATGRFDPQDACTRGQAAKMISIMIDPSLPREEPETTTTLRGSAATVARRATTTTVTTQPTITTTVTSH
jgi:hypothetical protein